MRDLRMVVPVVQADSDPAGRVSPSGFLFPNITRLSGDARPQLFQGVQKLVQQLYLEMFTDPLPNGVGSGLATRLRSATADDINSLARSGFSDLLSRLRVYQNGLDLPLDERISDLVVAEIRYDEANASFVIQLELTTEAGETFTLEPPLV